MKLLLSLCVALTMAMAAPNASSKVVEYKEGSEAGFVKRVIKFVDRSIEEATDYTKDEWKESRTQFSLLKDEYRKYYSNLSKEDKDTVNEYIGKYLGAATKVGVEFSMDYLKEFFMKAPSFFEGFWDTLMGN